MSEDTLQGDRRHLQRLRRLRANAKELGTAVFAAADAIKTDARLSITQNSISGKGHIASLPGQPPNRDTGHLDTNIEAYRTGPLKAEVKSKAEYAAALEYGTSKMAERPYMRPAVKRAKPKIMKFAKVSVERIVKRS